MNAFHIQLSAGEDLNVVLTSYGLPSSTSWYQCQATLSVLLGTYPRISARIKAEPPCWQAPWGPACADLASWPLSGLTQQPALGLVDGVDAEPQDEEMPTATSSDSAAFHAAETTNGTPTPASLLEIDDGEDAFMQDNIINRDFLSKVVASHLNLDARRKNYGRGILRSEVQSGNIQGFLRGDCVLTKSDMSQATHFFVRLEPFSIS